MRLNRLRAARHVARSGFAMTFQQQIINVIAECNAFEAGLFLGDRAGTIVYPFYTPGPVLAHARHSDFGRTDSEKRADLPISSSEMEPVALIPG